MLIVGLLLTDLLSIAFVWIAVYLVYQWYLYQDVIAHQEYAQHCLIIAIALIIYMLIGKSLLPFMLSKSRKGEDQPVAERLPEQEQLVRPDGSVINIEHGGVGGKPVIIFIHGWNSNSLQWYYQKKYFADNYHLILMDLPGLGKSKRPKNRDFSLENLASHLDAVIEHTQAKDPVLWGHSMGGMTILTWCKIYPEKLSKVKGLILEHTTFTNPTRTSILSGLLTSIQNPILKPICWLMILLSPILWIDRWLSYLNGNMLIMTRWLTFAGTQTHKQLDFTSLLSAMAPPAITARGVLGMFNYDATAVLKDLTLTVLIVGADHDRLTKLEASITMSDKIPSAKLYTLSPAGHMGLIERHQEVNRRVSDFLKSLQKPV